MDLKTLGGIQGCRPKKNHHSCCSPLAPEIFSLNFSPFLTHSHLTHSLSEAVSFKFPLVLFTAMCSHMLFSISISLGVAVSCFFPSPALSPLFTG